MQVLAHIKDMNKDFWEQNQQLAYMSPFHELKKNNKNSSSVMMALYMIYDAKSPFRATGMTEEEIISDVNKNFLKDEKFPWQDYQVYVDAYKDKCRSMLHKKLDTLMREILEMEQRRTELSVDDPFEMEQKIKLFDAVSKWYDKAIELQQKLNEEVSEQAMYGDYAPSLIEGYSLK
jgi:type I site-specific restriction endonuclease